MKPTNPTALLGLLLLLTACGGTGDAAPGRPCDRLGLLCGDDRNTAALRLSNARNVSADLDADGQLDLVTAGGAAGLSIAWAGSSRDYRLFPGAVTDAKVGDLDRDSDLDIAFLTTEPAALHVLTGARARDFSDGTTIALAGRPQALWLGSLDADDRPDAVVASGDAGTLTVLTDGLTRARPIVLGRDLVAVDVADIDGDDDLDLVTLDRADAAFYIVLASGEDFAAPRRVATGLGPTFLQILDHDGDGHTDVLTHGKGPEIWFHQGDGSGGFAPARALLVQKEASNGFGAHRDDQGRRWLLTIDYANVAATRLGDDDRIAGRIRGGGTLSLTGLGMQAGAPLAHGDWRGASFSLEPAHIFSELWHGGTYSEEPLVFSDFDRDGEPEFSTLVDTTLTIYDRLDDGTWIPGVTLELAAPGRDHTIADISGDGRPDILIRDQTPALFAAIAAGDGTFTFTPPIDLVHGSIRLLTAVPPGGGAATLLVHDRYSASTEAPPGVYPYRFDGVTLVPDPQLPQIPNLPGDLAIADLDGDGGDDLVALTYDAEQLPTLTIVLATADGWAPPRSRILDLDLTSTRLTLGDLDLDGTIDALFVGAERITRLLDIHADDPPAPQVDDVLLPSPDRAAIADADADGRPDLVLCTSDGLTIVLADADGAWRPQPPFDSYHTNCALHVDPTDLRPLALLADSGALTLLAPDRAPSLARSATFAGGPSPFSWLAVGDLDADDHPDIVATASSASQLISFSSTAILWGRPDGRPQRATSTESIVTAGTLPLLVPLDDRPGDELILTPLSGATEIWTHVDGALVLRSRAAGSSSWNLALGVQKRSDDPPDLILLTSPDLHNGDLHAIPLDERGELQEAGRVTLLSGAEFDPSQNPLTILTIADFDADGYDDIVMTRSASARLYLVWGDKQRKPTVLDLPPLPGEVTPTTRNTITTTAADMNDDGRPELIVGIDQGVFSYAFTGRKPAAPVALINSSALYGLLVADLEGDAYPDLLRSTQDLVNVTLRAPGGDDRVQLPIPRTWSNLRAADLDGDGILDIVGLRNGNVTTRLSAPQ